MSITTDRIARKANGIGGKARPLDDNVKSYLFEALGSTLDSLVIGVIIVADEGRILHANQAAQTMLDAVADRLARRLSRRIAGRSHQGAEAGDRSGAGRCKLIGAAGIGVPLVDKDMTAATAHVLPLGCGDPCTPRSAHKSPPRSLLRRRSLRHLPISAPWRVSSG